MAKTAEFDALVRRLCHVGKHYEEVSGRKVVAVPGQRDIIEQLVVVPSPVNLVGYAGTGKSLAMAHAVEQINDAWSREGTLRIGASNGSGASLSGVAFLISLPELQREALSGGIASGLGVFSRIALSDRRLWGLLAGQVRTQAKELEGRCEKNDGRLVAIRAFLKQWPQEMERDGEIPQGEIVALENRKGGDRGNAIVEAVEALTILTRSLFAGRKRRLGAMGMQATLQAAATAMYELAGSGTIFLFIDDYSECQEGIRRWLTEQIDALYAISLNRSRPFRLRLSGYPSHRVADVKVKKVYADYFTASLFVDLGYQDRNPERIQTEFFRDIILEEGRNAGISNTDDVLGRRDDLVFWARLAGLVGANPRRYGQLLEGLSPASLEPRISVDRVTALARDRGVLELKNHEELTSVITRRDKTREKKAAVQSARVFALWERILQHLRLLARDPSCAYGPHHLLVLPERYDAERSGLFSVRPEAGTDYFLKPLRDIEILINSGYLFPVKTAEESDGSGRRLLVIGVTDQMRMASGLVDGERGFPSWLKDSVVAEEGAGALVADDAFWNQGRMHDAMEALYG